MGGAVVLSCLPMLDALEKNKVCSTVPTPDME